jgi:hypothetical protein
MFFSVIPSARNSEKNLHHLLSLKYFSLCVMELAEDVN